MSTTAVPSKMPEDFALNIENLDKFTNSTSSTFTDRLGGVKKTIVGVLAEYPNASGNAAAAAASADASEASRQASAAQAVISTTQAVISTTQAGLAATAKTQAESARDAAMVSGKVYTSTAAGLAATTTTQYFSVPSADSDESLILYLNSAGTAVEQKRYPGTAKLAPFLSLAPAGYAWSVVDEFDQAALGVRNDGTVVAKALAVEQMAVDAITPKSVTVGGIAQEEQSLPGIPISVTDDDGKVAFGIKSSGLVEMKAAQIETLNGVLVQQLIAGTGGSASGDIGAQNFGADINHILVYGQSLSCGVSVPSILTTTPRFDTLRFSGGVRAQDAGSNPAVKYASLVPLIETVVTPAEAEAPGTYQRETPCAGMAEYIKELVASENGIAYTDQSFALLMSAPGRGAQTIANLSKPGGLYTRMVADVQYGYNLAQAAGKTYKVPCLAWLQGESDGTTAVATYAAALNQLRVDFDADVKAITGQTENVILISYQTGQVGNARLGQLLASEIYPHIYIAAPNYVLPKSDGTHYMTASSKIFGAYLGQVHKRVVVDGKPWKPVQLLTAYRQGKILNARFNVVKGPLVFDSASVTGQTNNGFTLVDSAGTAIAITSITLTGPDTVRVVAATAIPAGARLQYGMANTFGNLRDSGGLTKIFGGNGLNHPMYNWCMNFDKSIA